MIDDSALTKSISSIIQRSERQTDEEKLASTYVDSGILQHLLNRNHQIVYGRRGTGKTHIFKVIKKKIEEQSQENKVIYFDCRTFGSSSQFNDTAVGMGTRCLSLFRDFSEIVYNSLLDYITNDTKNDHDKAFELLAQLSDALLNKKNTYSPESVVRHSASGSSESLKTGAGLSGIKPHADITFGATQTQEYKTVEKISVHSEDKVIFGEIHNLLSQITRLLGIEVYFLIDEWSSLPLDIQPYFAEFIRRSYLANSGISVKIAALEHRSHFYVNEASHSIGIEPGADITIAIDIDDYYVYDRNPEEIVILFSDILYKHISTGMAEGYLERTLRIPSHTALPSRLFTTSKVFEELVRSSEGVARDLINIFTNAYFDARRRKRDSIDRQAVLGAARSWYEKDKSEVLDDNLRAVLYKIISEVIGKKNARSFMLPRELQKHQTIQRLFDSRVLHLVQRGYADKDNPGKRYNIYCLDYGTYVHLVQTQSLPNDYIVDDAHDTNEWIVPFDDKRSIRRIILQESILDNSTS